MVPKRFRGTQRVHTAILVDCRGFHGLGNRQQRPLLLISSTTLELGKWCHPDISMSSDDRSAKYHESAMAVSQVGQSILASATDLTPQLSVSRRLITIVKR